MCAYQVCLEYYFRALNYVKQRDKYLQFKKKVSTKILICLQIPPKLI